MAEAIRVCFFGDSFVNGTGDDACLGWVGRACAAGRENGADLTCYNLGIRGDSSADVLRRWEHEARARLPPEHDGRLVFSFGANDCCLRDDASQVRVPLDEALANARAILGVGTRVASDVDGRPAADMRSGNGRQDRDDVDGTCSSLCLARRALSRCVPSCGQLFSLDQ